MPNPNLFLTIAHYWLKYGEKIMFWIIFFVVVLFVVWYTPNCFAKGKESTSMQIMRFGSYKRTIFCKKDFTLNDDGYIVSGESLNFHIGGLYWVSFWKPWGIDKIYTRTMRFDKALPDGTLEKHEDPDTNFMLTGMQYQYMLTFESAEDSDGLPLSGKMTMTAMIVNPRKALFDVKEWFYALVGRVLPVVREYISEHSYEKLINDKSVKLDQDVFKALNEKCIDSSDQDNDTKKSIIDILYKQYGIALLALETVNIDPPPEYREVTLKKYLADQEAKAAVGKAQVEKTLAGDPIRLAMQEWVESQKEDGETTAQAHKRLIASGAYAAHERTVKDIILAKNGNLQVSRTEFGSPDGTPLPSTLQYLSVGGGGGGGVLFNAKSQRQSNPGRKGGKKPTKLEDRDDDEEF